MKPGTRHETLLALRYFERLIKPKRLGQITTWTIDDYKANRRKEPGRRRGDLISPATLNKELWGIRSVLGVAQNYGYLREKPKFKMLKEPYKLPIFVTPELFAAM